MLSNTLIFMDADREIQSFAGPFTNNEVFVFRKAKPKISFLNQDLERTGMPEEEVKGNPEAPEAQFEIEHVYGYRASDCQQNL